MAATRQAAAQVTEEIAAMAQRGKLTLGTGIVEEGIEAGIEEEDDRRRKDAARSSN